MNINMLQSLASLHQSGEGIDDAQPAQITVPWQQYRLSHFKSYSNYYEFMSSIKITCFCPFLKCSSFCHWSEGPTLSNLPSICTSTLPGETLVATPGCFASQSTTRSEEQLLNQTFLFWAQWEAQFNCVNRMMDYTANVIKSDTILIITSFLFEIFPCVTWNTPLLGEQDYWLLELMTSGL